MIDVQVATDLARIETAIGGALAALEEEVRWQHELGNELREALEALDRIKPLHGLVARRV